MSSEKSRHGIPDVLMQHVDDYVDSLAPQIQPRITTELDTFQQRTIDSLEDTVVGAFRALFDKDRRSGTRDLDDSPPDSYGGKSLPFADEIAKLTRTFGSIADDASDDLREIFDLTDSRAASPGPQSRGFGDGDSSRGFGNESSRGHGAKGFLSAAINAVQDHLEKDNKGPGGSPKFELDGLLGILSSTVKDASRNPEEKARLISPEIRERVGEKLREQHAPIAEQFTRIALDHIKRWLRGNTSTRDLGDGAKGEIEDHVKDLVKGLGGLLGGHKKKPSSDGSRSPSARDRDEGESGGFSKMISTKLSTGLAKVHREVRLEFRKILGAIEKQLFEMLPDSFQRPLEKILGGNPFDSQLDRDAKGNADRGFGDDIKIKLVDKIRNLVRKVQELLREGILGLVNGGHRKFELASWVFVQNIVEGKVQKYLPKVKITVPDDIGNEGVSVGAPTEGSRLGGGQSGQQGSQSPAQPPRPNKQSPPSSSHQSHQSQNEFGYSQNQSSPGYQHQGYQSPGYQNQSHNQNQGYQSPGYNQSHNQNQGYQSPGYNQNQGYQNQEHQQSQGHGQQPSQGSNQGFGQNPQYY
jgi:hypothetical protein